MNFQFTYGLVLGLRLFTDHCSVCLAPRFVKKLPVSKEVKEGDDITVECRVDEADVGDVISDMHIRTTGN